MSKEPEKEPQIDANGVIRGAWSQELLDRWDQFNKPVSLEVVERQSLWLEWLKWRQGKTDADCDG